MTTIQRIHVIILVLLYSSYHIYTGIQMKQEYDKGYTGTIISKSSEPTRNGNHNKFYVDWNGIPSESIVVTQMEYDRYNIGDRYSVKPCYSIFTGITGDAYAPIQMNMFRCVLYMLTNAIIAILFAFGALTMFETYWELIGAKK